MAILSEEEVERQAEDEFRDEARDILNSLELKLAQVRSDPSMGQDAAKAFRRDVSNLHMRAKVFRSMKTLNVFTHRFDDYTAALRTIEVNQLADLQAYVDKVGAILDGEEIVEDVIREQVRALPTRGDEVKVEPKKQSIGTFDVKDVKVELVECMLVMPQRSAARVVERELQQCGYRVMNVLDPFDAIEMAVKARPDFVVTAAVLKDLSGVDLCAALQAMPKSKDIPTIVLTSLAPNHPDLQGLPLRTGLVRRGEHFGDDLAHALKRFDIT
mgnify:CR=1 FL=1